VKVKLFDLIISIILISCIIYLVYTYFYKGYTPWAIVGSYSMEPILELGDLIFIQSIPENIHPNDLVNKIVVYRKEFSNTLIVHRVIDLKLIKENGEKTWLLITKGDANLYVDINPPTINEVIGLVNVVIPKVGILGLLFKNLVYNPGIGFIILFLIVLYIICLYVISSLSRK